MLYQLHEIQRAFLDPMMSLADAVSKAYSHPYSPLAYLPFANRVSAGYELIVRLGKAYEKPEFGLHKTVVDGQEVPVLEKTVIDKPFCKLLHFERVFPEDHPARDSREPTVLLCAPLSGHHATLLRDTVRQLIQSHNVYVTDWINAREVPLDKGAFHLDDYIAYVQEFIRHIGKVEGSNVHIISVCQPTVPVLAAVSLMAVDQDPYIPQSMIMMGGPIDSRKSPTQVNALATTKPYSWFVHNVIFNVPAKYPGYLRLVYPGFMQHSGFVAMNPSRHVESHWDFYAQLVQGDDEDAESHRRFYDEYNAVIDLPAEYYLDTIKTVFQEHALARGIWSVKGRLIQPELIKGVALFTIEGEVDDISGNGQTEAAHRLCAGISDAQKEHYEVPEAGHYGIFSGKRWRRLVYPRIRDFIRKHHQGATAPDAKARPLTLVYGG